jgi:hypothetical protein
MAVVEVTQQLDILTVSTYNIMRQNEQSSSYEHLIEVCLVEDRTHWNDITARAPVTKALLMMGFNFHIEYNPVTCFRIVVQKHLKKSCFTCGSQSHQ